jgi:hypothetical protein
MVGLLSLDDNSPSVKILEKIRDFHWRWVSVMGVFSKFSSNAMGLLKSCISQAILPAITLIHAIHAIHQILSNSKHFRSIFSPCWLCTHIFQGRFHFLRIKNKILRNIFQSLISLWSL